MQHQDLFAKADNLALKRELEELRQAHSKLSKAADKEHSLNDTLNRELEELRQAHSKLSKAAADKEHSLNDTLNRERSEKATVERKFEDLEQMYAKLNENHHNSVKQHETDPFVTGPQDAQRQRYSALDNSQFSLYLNGSPAQAKRTLQAHLAETTRRLQETSRLGNALVQQRKELEEKLKEVEKQEEDTEIGPQLRQKLAELENEFNKVGRETARAFLPKSRVPSGEADTAAGASVYTSEALHSPSKISVPSRKQRNQQPSRINDIALATEISTSLLAQLKDLQAVLLEKDEALKAANLDRSQLEIEVEGLSQRLRTLDEGESRLKDVNWR